MWFFLFIFVLIKFKQMKKIILFLLLSIAGYGQTATGQEQEFDYNIKNNAAPTVLVPNYVTTSSLGGVYGKIEPANLPISYAVIDSLKLKSYLSTGLIKNGLVTTNADPTKFNITAGIGIISNFDDPENPTCSIINFPAFTGIIPTYLTTGNITYVAINSVPAVVMQATPFTNIQRRDLIALGAVIHSDLTTINLVNNISAPTNAGLNQLHDLMEAIGALNISGNKYAGNGNLTINKSAGVIFKLGVNFASNWKDPNNLYIAPQSALTFRYRTQNGTEGLDVTNIDPSVYDLNNVLTAVPVNRFSIQTVTLFQTGQTRIQYGQTTYATMAEAEAAIITRAYVVEPNIAANGITRAYIIVRHNATDLLNTTTSKIIEAQKFGGVASGGVALTDSAIIAALGYTPYNDDNIAGTANYIPKFTGSKTLGDSGITDNGAIISTTRALKSPFLSDLGLDVTIANKNKTTQVLKATNSSGSVFNYQYNYWNGSAYILTESIGIGLNSLQNNIGANANGFGAQALQNNTGANANGFGYLALFGNTGANANGFGAQALQNNTGANSNGIGYLALFNNTGATSNGFGAQALQNNTGANASGFGYLSLLNNAGSNANGFGNQALFVNTGSNANGFGNQALFSNVGVNANGFGLNALYNNNYANVVSFGASSTAYFNPNSATTKSFTEANINATTKAVTITAHGFGTTGTKVNIRFTGTGSPLPTGLVNGTVYQVTIADANTVTVPSITTTGTSVLGNFTKDFDITGATQIGYNTYASGVNEVIIGSGTISNGANSVTIGAPTTIKTILNGRALIGTTVDDGVNVLQLTGTAKLSTNPTTSAGTYDILTRNTSTGVVEKVASTTVSPWTITGNNIKTNNIGKTFIGDTDTFGFTYDYGLGVSGKIATATGFRANSYRDLGEFPLISSDGSGNISLYGANSLSITTDLNRVSFSKPVKLKNYTVATLPTGTQGDTAYVTDATTPTYLGTLTGGGSVVCPVFYNGISWVAH